MKYLKNRTFYNLSLRWVMLFCLLVFTGLALGQTRTHNLGDYKYRVEANDYINTNEVDPTGEWPQDHFRYGTIVFYHCGCTVGKWIDAQGVEHTKESFFYPGFNEEEPYGIKEYRRFAPPKVYVFSEGQLLESSRPYDGEIDPNLPADQMIEVRYKKDPGFDVLKRSYAFSNPYHDDYVIVYTRYLVTFDWDQDPEPDTDTGQTMENVYFFVGYSNQTAEGTYITWNQWYEEAQDDWATYDTYQSTGRELAISYAWDGDHPEWTEFEPGGPAFDDTGDPRFAVGEGGDSEMPSAEFISNAYAGFAALHVDTSPTDQTDWLSQPFSIIANIDIYNVWDENFTGYTTVWDWAASGHRQKVEEQAGWPTDPMDQLDEFAFQSYGPYNLTLGDSIVIVYAVGANGISTNLAISKGLEWRDWYRGVAGASFDDDAKNDLLATGKDSLFQTMDRAMWAWNRGLDIPDPLPAPDLNVTSGPNVIYLEWTDLSGEGDPDTGVPDLDHYNIYRKVGNFLVDEYDELNPNGTHILWELLTTVPANVTEYVDSTAVRGYPYHYAVTAVDDGSQNSVVPGQQLESSLYANRSEIAAFAFAPGADNTNQIRIVPNPFIASAGDYNYPGQYKDDLNFVNLPPYCTLRIYTVTGDLIKTIEHQTGSADERWDQITEYNQRIASGVYILQIDNAKDLNENSLPGAIEKFVVVR
jgi:hypothetical protein